MIGFAVCHLPFIPVRREPDHRSEQVTQVLFGEIFLILESNSKNWHLVEMEEDGYRGWLTLKDPVWINEEEFKHLRDQTAYFVSDIFALAGGADSIFFISAGSRLPQWDGFNFRIGREVLSVRGEVIQRPEEFNPDMVLHYAMKFLRIPYLWGGRSAFGFDCSGFIQTVFKLSGLRLPRDASQQYRILESGSSEKRNKVNLAFFGESEDRITHVGVCAGENSIIHCSEMVRMDKIDEKGIFNEKLNSYTHRLVRLCQL